MLDGRIKENPRNLGPPDLAFSIVIAYHQIKDLSGGPIPGPKARKGVGLLPDLPLS